LAHRDIKPANIVLLEDLTRLVLLDFGVLKPIGEAGLTDVDDQRLFLGTLHTALQNFCCGMK
jgi:serine/threonine protein kinase